MTVSLGRIVAELAEPNQETTTELVELINANVRPPSKVSVDDVFIRAMYVVSDEVNSFGGRFPADEHTGLVSLMIDSPVLVGHRKDQLPIGRTFHAMTVERNGRPWVKSYFYWLKSSERAEDIRANLDGGIYKECSLAFTFHLPECSVCGKDIRRCQHQPFESYEGGSAVPCHFNYRRIEKVLETSLVYRGAVPDTAVANDLDEAKPTSPVSLGSLVALDDDADYLVTPRYDGLEVAASFDNSHLTIHGLSGEIIHRAETRTGLGAAPDHPVQGMLVGQRGKERCRLGQLQDYLAGRRGPVTRLVLNLYPHQGVVMPPRIGGRSSIDVRVFPYRISDRTNLERAAREIMTRDGVEIRPLGRRGRSDQPDAVQVYLFQPSAQAGLRREADEFTLAIGDSTARLTIATGHGISNKHENLTLDLTAFDSPGLLAGHHFLATPTEPSTVPELSGRILRGRIGRVQVEGDALLFDATGELTGAYYLRPIRLHGRECYLFGRRIGGRVAEIAR